MSDDAPSKLGYAAPLEYSQPAAARPIIITAIGVLSIVLGALSALTNLAGTMTNLLHLALAGFLLCIGVMAVCGSGRGIRLHWWFVAVKIPAVLVAAAVSVWVWSGLMKGINAAITPPPGAGAGPQMSVTRVLMISAVVGAGVALIYPLLLTFLLTRRTVRDYVGAIRG